MTTAAAGLISAVVGTGTGGAMTRIRRGSKDGRLILCQHALRRPEHIVDQPVILGLLRVEVEVRALRVSDDLA